MTTAMLSKAPAVLLGSAASRRSPVAFSSGCSTRVLRAVAPRPAPAGPTSSGRAVALVLRASNDDKQVAYNKEFGYSRKDVILIGVGLIALGYALYYGLQAGGMEPGMAGNWVQLIIFMGICVGWISTYIFRVATKQMTYVKQLEQYEEAVMRKRVEEMTEAELEQLAGEVDADKQRKAAARAAAAAQQQQAGKQ